MTDQDRGPMPKYLFHWLSVVKLEQMVSSGELKPGWTHYLLDHGRFVKGTSTCDEPMLWNPDEGLSREPCIVLERAQISVPVWHVNSSETFHLTKKVRRAMRAGEDIEPILVSARDIRTFCHGGWDEFFVEGAIPLSAVVGIGFEEGGKADRKTVATVQKTAERIDLPLIDMTGWAVGSPDPEEVDEIVEEARTEANQRMMA